MHQTVKLHRLVGVRVWPNHKSGVTGYRNLCPIDPTGVQISRYITSHGFSINCNTDLSRFSRIVACGLGDKSATSLSYELGQGSAGDDVTVEQAVPVVLDELRKLLQCPIEPLETMDMALYKEINAILHGDVARVSS